MPSTGEPTCSSLAADCEALQRNAVPADGVDVLVVARLRGWRLGFRFDEVVGRYPIWQPPEATASFCTSVVSRAFRRPLMLTHGTRLRRAGEKWSTLIPVRVLVADDDPAVSESLRRSLTFNGYEVTTVQDGAKALDAIAQNPPDAVILDVSMPNLDGLETCRRIRASGDDLPVLMLTARDDVRDRVMGLDAGADDYLPKPFALEELLARLRALLRRSRKSNSPPTDDEQPAYVFADLRLDPGTREVTRGARQLRLTRTEFALLETFLQYPRQVLSRAQILDEVWGYDFPTTANSLEVYVGYLRRKTEEAGEARLIHTVRGVGYVLRESPP